MTVKELKERLNEFNENLQVGIITGSGWETCNDEVTTIDYDKYENTVYIY